MPETEIEYARRRTAEELDRAESSSDPDVAHVHRRLAILYANMVAELHHLTPLELAEQKDLPRPPRQQMPIAQSSPMMR